MRILKHTFAMALLLLTTNSWAIGTRGGGIIIAAEFGTAGRSALKILSDGDTTLNLNSMLSQIKDVKVIPVDNICYTDPVLKKQFCEDAHYDSVNNVILLNFTRWDTFSCQEKILLSSHELLRASGMETEDYTYSGRFLTQRMATCEGSGGSTQDQLKCADLATVVASEFNELCKQLKMFADERQK